VSGTKRFAEASLLLLLLLLQVLFIGSFVAFGTGAGEYYVYRYTEIVALVLITAFILLRRSR